MEKAKEGEEYHVVGPSIIAMKGHPGTGKSTLAKGIASRLRCPLLDKDDIRDATLPLQRHPVILSSPSTASSLLNDLSYSALWHIASAQLHLGLTVVIDSPLSRRAHLDSLMDIARTTGARVFVIECKPKDEGEWRRRLERRGAGIGASWHKPSTWRDIERLLEGYGGCTEYDMGHVPKLVVDTTASPPPCGDGAAELVASVIEFIKSHGGHIIDPYSPLQRVEEDTKACQKF